MAQATTYQQDTALSTYRIQQIPPDLYNNWREIVWNMSDTAQMQKAVWRMLKAWIWARYPTDKLCAFDDFRRSEAEQRGLKPGMYIVLRAMTPEELILNERARRGEIPAEEDPQWMLEKPELNEYYQTARIDYLRRPEQPLLQGEL
jgi:hypothetical protein